MISVHVSGMGWREGRVGWGGAVLAVGRAALTIYAASQTSPESVHSNVREVMAPWSAAVNHGPAGQLHVMLSQHSSLRLYSARRGGASPLDI